LSLVRFHDLPFASVSVKLLPEPLRQPVMLEPAAEPATPLVALVPVALPELCAPWSVVPFGFWLGLAGDAF
jgi:hypothetical protein